MDDRGADRSLRGLRLKWRRVGEIPALDFSQASHVDQNVEQVDDKVLPAESEQLPDE